MRLAIKNIDSTRNTAISVIMAFSDLILKLRKIVKYFKFGAVWVKHFLWKMIFWLRNVNKQKEKIGNLNKYIEIVKLKRSTSGRSKKNYPNGSNLLREIETIRVGIGKRH